MTSISACQVALSVQVTLANMDITDCLTLVSLVCPLHMEVGVIAGLPHVQAGLLHRVYLHVRVQSHSVYDMSCYPILRRSAH